MKDLLTRRDFLRLVGLSSAGLVIASCAPPAAPAPNTPAAVVKPASVPVLRLGGGDNGYPSPFTYVRGPGYVRMILLFDTLVWKDSQGYIPWLATDWKVSDDGKTWTFTLRDGAKWHDSKPLTADDVVFTYDYVRKQQGGTAVVRGLEAITSATKVDERHVQLVLAQPNAPFFGNIAAAQPIIPKHIWEKVADPSKLTTPEAVIGSGPYKLISYDKASGAYLYEANADFWLGKPFVQRIELVPTGDELLALKQGAVDAAGLPSEGGVTDEVLVPFQSSEFGNLTAPGEWNPAVHFNLAKGAPYNDVKFRRAWAYAIDRDDLVKRLLQGRGEPGNLGWLPPSNPWYNANVERYKFDAAKAKSLLDEAGYKDTNGDGVRELPSGKPLEVPLVFDANGFVRIAEILRDRLKDVGIAVTPKPVDRTTMDSMTSSGNFEAAITYYGGLGGDPDYMRQVFASKSPSKSFQRVLGYNNPRFDELADQQLNETKK